MGQKRDILIRVYGRPDANSSYPVDAELDDNSYFFGGEIRIPERDLLKLSLDIPAYGAKLGQVLFSAPIQRALEKAYATVAAARDTELRVRLCFYPDASELHAYPWERILAPWQGKMLPVAASSRIPFSRFVQLQEGQLGPVEDRPIRLLFAVANPHNLPAGLHTIPVEDELAGLLEAVRNVDDLSIAVLPGVTGLSDALKARFPAVVFVKGSTTLDRIVGLAGRSDAVHLLCHGQYQDGTATLCLEDEAGEFAPAVDTAIQTSLLSLAAKPRLIYLSACQSALQDSDDLAALDPKPRQPHPMVGLAPKLVEAEIAAVIAMQDFVRMDAAHLLAGEFYSRLLESGEVDRALSEARQSIYDPASKEWAIPALFLRLRDGRLFATDPAREAILVTRQRFPPPKNEESFYLPLEAVSLTTPSLIADWERSSQLTDSAQDLWTSIKNFQPGLTVVIGDAGSGKSMLLQRLTRFTATEAAAPGVRNVALLVDLREYANVRAFTGSRIRALLFEAFRALVPSLSEDRFGKLIQSGSVQFRFLIDHADELPDRVRRSALDEIGVLAKLWTRHQFVIALDCRYFDGRRPMRELLVIQPLSIRKVDNFLDPPDAESLPERTKLLDSIRTAGLYQFASVPWLLLHMLDQVKQDALPKSRIMVLLDWLETAMDKMSDDGVRNSRVPESLAALAWTMQSAMVQTLKLESAFDVLNQVRGQRDYNLEELLDSLVGSAILVRSGDESIRFAYRPLQDFCSARHLLNDPALDTQLGEIVATLGSPQRVRWWTAALALLAGMLDDPAGLLKKLIYGASLTQGEHVFVAASCLLERDRQQGPAPAGGEIENLRRQVCAALQWRARRANESIVEYRAQAVDFLGAMRRAESIPLLVRLAIEKARVAEGKPPDYEYSQVRFAAIRALRTMRANLGSDLIQKYPDAPFLIKAWEGSSVDDLAALLHSQDVGIQGVAAFALGDLQNPQAAGRLYDAFQSPDTDPATLWAVTDALQAIDPSRVASELVLPLIRQARTAAQPPVENRYERLLYLIGQLRLHDAEAIGFLTWYLQKPLDPVFKGRAMVSIGMLHAWSEAQEFRFGDVARGDLTPIAGADADAMYLRRKAIEALGELGTLEILYATRQDGAEWTPELDEAFFRAAEACASSPQQKGPTNGTK